MFAIAGPGAAASWGAVEFNAASCAQVDGTSLSIPVPAGTQSGDLLVATVGFANSDTAATPSGWTQVPGLRGTVGTGQEGITWYRFVGASVPSSYTFSGSSGTDTIAGGIAAFSGADPAAPIASGAGQAITALSTSDTLPNASGTRLGSVRYSAAVSDDRTTATYSAPLSKVCDENNETGIDIATSMAWEPTGTGTTATRTISRSDNAKSVLQTLVITPPPCGTGILDWTPPSAVTFPTTVLNGLDRTVATSVTAEVDDQSSAHTGWSISGTSTRFTTGTRNLPTGATQITGVGATAGAGNCSMPVNSVSYPIGLPAGATAPTAVKLYNAASGTGAGPVDLGIALSLLIPAQAYAGNYSSTWTLTLATGP